MLTWEGSWPNSLVRRPPWLQACSVKNKTTCLKLYSYIIIYPSILGSHLICLFLHALYALNTTITRPNHNTIQVNSKVQIFWEDLKIWKKSPYIFNIHFHKMFTLKLLFLKFILVASNKIGRPFQIGLLRIHELYALAVS